MFAEDISEDFAEVRKYHFYWNFEHTFAEDYFLLRSFQKFLPSGFLPISRFQTISGLTKDPCGGQIDRKSPVVKRPRVLTIG